MGTPIEQKLRTAAAAYAPLTSLLGTSPFRWWDTQLVQQSAYPAVVVQLISNASDYNIAGRYSRSWCRVQFTIWGGQFAAGTNACETVVSALSTFLDQFNAIGTTGLIQYPCMIVANRRGLFPATDGPIFQKIVDAMIFNDDSI